MSIEILPAEIICSIQLCLNDRDCARLTRVNKHLSQFEPNWFKMHKIKFMSVIKSINKIKYKIIKKIIKIDTVSSVQTSYRVINEEPGRVRKTRYEYFPAPNSRQVSCKEYGDVVSVFSNLLWKGKFMSDDWLEYCGSFVIKYVKWSRCEVEDIHWLKDTNNNVEPFGGVNIILEIIPIMYQNKYSCCDKYHEFSQTLVNELTMKYLTKEAFTAAKNKSVEKRKYKNKKRNLRRRHKHH